METFEGEKEYYPPVHEVIKATQFLPGLSESFPLSLHKVFEKLYKDDCNDNIHKELWESYK